MSQQKALFLDRDGIINKDIGYAYQPKQIEWVEGIFELCRHFYNEGYLLIIVTNQSGIARGFYTEEQFEALVHFFETGFKREGLSLTHTYHCPHHPDITGPCDCRKPKPGMLLEAIETYHIDPKASIMIGDKASDMEAAYHAGIDKRWLLSVNEMSETPMATRSAATLLTLLTYD